MEYLAQLDLILLFFFLGIAGGLAKVSLKLPESISQFLSVYLLLTIGFKGGLAVANAENLEGIVGVLGIALVSCLVIPLIVFRLANKPFGVANGAALAASYGSVSAVTFIVASSILESKGISSSGYMVAIVAVMEVPAIAIALLLYQTSFCNEKMNWSALFRAALAHKSILLLAGGFLIGAVIDEKNQTAFRPTFVDAFKGVLAFYLLDLGAIAASELRAVWSQRVRAMFFACVLPLCFGQLALLAAWLAGLSQGDAILLSVLIGSASYIAAPAAMRISIPEASPAVYSSLPLGITFPFNVTFGIPLYLVVSRFLWGS